MLAGTLRPVRLYFTSEQTDIEEVIMKQTDVIMHTENLLQALFWNHCLDSKL
jgi:hypothetical protein